MLRTLTPREMAETEKRFMQETGVPGALLMEHAAQGVADALCRLCPNFGTALFLCGPGNNGGDGYAAARLWHQRGGRSVIWELSAQARGDAALNRVLCLRLDIPVATLRDAPSALPPCDVICDALFGTGLSKPVEGIAAALVRCVNESGKPVVAVDIPSGLDGETGAIWGEAVRATETVTFHRIKQGCVLRSGAACSGQIHVQPILMPPDAGPEGLMILSPSDLASVLPPRPVDAHKGSFGRVVIYAGSPGMAGAAALCARAAIRSGAGLTHVLCRASLWPIVQVLVPGATCTPLPEENEHLTEAALSLAREALRGASCAAFGCGAGQGDDLLPLMAVFDEAPCPVVWDADGLNLKARHHLPFSSHAFITPHPAEAARLLGWATGEVLEHPLMALDALQALCPNVLLKGARTLMADQNGARAVNLYGSPALAKGGSGDVLTGMLCALLARPLPALSAMQTAALCHGLAGIRAQKRLGENCVTPEALLDAIRLDNLD